jgi:hypothetical protein
MTTGTGPEPPEASRRWAAEQLGVGPDASPREARAAFLRLLLRTNFVPPVRCCRAWRLLSDPAGAAPPDPDALLDEEGRLRQEVEGFAGQFWGLTPEERRQRWQGLSARCAGLPALRAGLGQLEAGLAVGPVDPTRDGEPVAELAGAVRELFVLRPADRASARQELLLRLRRDLPTWQAAARRLRKRHPEIDALAPGLLTAVESWHLRERHLADMRLRLERAHGGQPGMRTLLRPRVVLLALPVLIYVGILLLGLVSNPPPGPSPLPPPALTARDREGPPPDMPPEMERLTRDILKRLPSTAPVKEDGVQKLLDEPGHHAREEDTGPGEPGRSLPVRRERRPHE